MVKSDTMKLHFKVGMYILGRPKQSYEKMLVPLNMLNLLGNLKVVFFWLKILNF